MKLNNELIRERIAAVHKGAPDSQLLIDANESWALDVLNDYAPLLADIKARDERDSQRSASPLKPATDAMVLDSTQLNIEQVNQRILAEAGVRGLL